MRKLTRESDIQKAIIAAHRATGWFVTKLLQSSTNGIPDIMMIKRKRVVFIEVKSPGNKSTPLQSYVQLLLRHQGMDVFETSDPEFFIR